MASADIQDETDETLPHSKPPFLRRVRIRGYKSIAFCDVTLEPLTVLVGRNGSGKSNFLDALGFLRDLMDKGLNLALQQHGGTTVFSKSLNTNRLTLEIETTFPSHQMECHADYRLDLQLSSRNQFEVVSETLSLRDVTRNQSCGFTASRNGVTWDGLEFFGEGRYRRMPPQGGTASGAEPSYPFLFDQYRHDRLLLGVIGSQPFIDLADGIRSLGCFNFHPNAMRLPQPNVGSPELMRDGRNLARAIEGLKEISEEDLTRVKAYLKAIVPEIDDFDVVQIGSFETLRFHLHSTISGRRIEFHATSMSDGTLRTLATLIAAFQIVLPHGYPSLVGIEEPETALHPAAMNALVDALDEATMRTQVIITTHSADLLDNSTIKPENVRVVQMIDGQTTITPIDDASVEIVQRDLNTLGGLERDNLLEPNLGDLERQQKLRQSLEAE